MVPYLNGIKNKCLQIASLLPMTLGDQEISSVGFYDTYQSLVKSKPSV